MTVLAGPVVPARPLENATRTGRTPAWRCCDHSPRIPRIATKTAIRMGRLRRWFRTWRARDARRVCVSDPGRWRRGSEIASARTTRRRRHHHHHRGRHQRHRRRHRRHRRRHRRHRRRHHRRHHRRRHWHHYDHDPNAGVNGSATTAAGWTTPGVTRFVNDGLRCRAPPTPNTRPPARRPLPPPPPPPTTPRRWRCPREPAESPPEPLAQRTGRARWTATATSYDVANRTADGPGGGTRADDQATPRPNDDDLLVLAANGSVGWNA